MNGNGNGHHGSNGSSRRWSSFWGRKRTFESDLNPYRRLALQLHYDMPHQESPRSVLLVTPRPSKVCALGSAALARCFADEIGQPVLLIDACPRGPEVSRLLDCTKLPGFLDVLTNPQLTLEDVVLSTTHHNVSFLPAGFYGGTSHTAPQEEIHALLHIARAKYDFVLAAGGSVLNDSTVLALLPHVGCVLLLAIENETMIEDLDAAQQALQVCRARKVRLVLTTPLRHDRLHI